MDLEEQTADERRIRACGWHELCMYFLLCFVSPSQLDADAETLRGVLCVLWDHVAAFRNGTTWKTNMHLDNHWLVEENNLRGGPLSGSKSTLSFRSLDFLLLHLYRPHTHTLFGVSCRDNLGFPLCVRTPGASPAARAMPPPANVKPAFKRVRNRPPRPLRTTERSALQHILTTLFLLYSLT